MNGGKVYGRKRENIILLSKKLVLARTSQSSIVSFLYGSQALLIEGKIDKATFNYSDEDFNKDIKIIMNSDEYEEIKKVRGLLDSGILTQKDFNKRKKLLNL